MSRRRFIINPNFSSLPVEEGIVQGVWYVICTTDCSSNYHRNYSAMGSKVMCFNVDYRPNTVSNGQARLLQQTVEYVLRCQEEYDKRRRDEPHDSDLANEFFYKTYEFMLPFDEEEINMQEEPASSVEGVPNPSPAPITTIQTMADKIEKAIKAPGAFMASLIRSNSEIKRDRAANIFEGAEVRYRRTVEDLEAQLKRMKRDRENKLDLSPTSKDSLMLAGEFDDKAFVEQDLQTSLDIRNLEIKLQVAQDRYAFLFKGVAVPAELEEAIA